MRAVVRSQARGGHARRSRQMFACRRLHRRRWPWRTRARTARQSSTWSASSRRVHGVELRESARGRNPCALGGDHRTCGVERIVYLSILGADERSPNPCLRSKAQAEALLHRIIGAEPRAARAHGVSAKATSRVGRSLPVLRGSFNLTLPRGEQGTADLRRRCGRRHPGRPRV